MKLLLVLVFIFRACHLVTNSPVDQSFESFDQMKKEFYDEYEEVERLHEKLAQEKEIYLREEAKKLAGRTWWQIIGDNKLYWILGAIALLVTLSICCCGCCDDLLDMLLRWFLRKCDRLTKVGVYYNSSTNKEETYTPLPEEAEAVRQLQECIDKIRKAS